MHWTTQSPCFMGKTDQIQVSDSSNSTLTLAGFQLGPPRALKGPHLPLTTFMARWLVGNESNPLDCMLIDPFDTTLTHNCSLYYQTNVL